MYFTQIEIKNYRCFEKRAISFATPDSQNIGSGLNIFIGENGLGKTTVLESIGLLTQSRLKTKGTIKITDFLDISKPLHINGRTKPFELDSVYGKTPIQCAGLSFEANARKKDAQGLIDPISFDSTVVPVGSVSQKSYELRTEVTKPWGASRLPRFEVIYFDKNRTRHLSSGLYTTKLDSIIDDFNSQVLLKLNSLSDQVEVEKLEKDDLLTINSQLLSKYSWLSDKLITSVNDDFSNFFSGKVSFDIFKNLEPYSSSFFSFTPNGSQSQVPISRMGSGVEMLFSIFLLFRFYSLEKVPLILLIDEPEMHLHPVWQLKLIEFLKNISRDIQIFISTHSPYIYKQCIKSSAKLQVFTTDKKQNIQISEVGPSYCKTFPWSPTWAEINYFAFNLPSPEFHNELYSYLQYQNKCSDTVTMEAFLISKSLSQNKPYIWKNKDGSAGKTYKFTLPTYIRHKMHHMDNQYNLEFGENELSESIRSLISFV